MQFLVQLEVNTPPDWSAEKLSALQSAERERALELMHAGLLRRVFRVPGLRGNLGLWESDSLEALHATLNALPMWNVMRASVTPVFAHPHESTYLDRYGHASPGTVQPYRNLQGQVP